MRNQARPIPRRKMPSLRKHGLSAILLLAIVALSLGVWAQHVKRSEPVLVPQIEVPLKRAEVSKTEPKTALPDLLEDDVPLDANPTETIDLLGAPETGSKTGPRPPGNTALPNSSAPKTILIDGRPVSVGGVKPLIPAPIQGLSTMSPHGPIPAIAEDGRTALNAYAKPFSPHPDKTQISLVVGGLGLNNAVTRRAIDELPAEITLAFAAQTPGLQNWIDRARARGHEVMIELPMEGGGPKPGEPGAQYTLSTQNLNPINDRNLDYLLSRASGYFAVTNYGGDTLITNPKSLSPILSRIRTAGLGFVYDGGTTSTVLKQIAGPTKTVTANRYLDANNQDPVSVMAQINALQGSAKTPIGMGFSYPGTIDGIKQWVEQKPETIELAPVSFALLRQ